MRAVGFVLALLLPITAMAQGFRDVVVQPPRARHSTVQPRITQFTQVSHTIYMNNCMPNGCTVYPGYDDSLTQHSSIPQSQSHLAAWAWGQPAWDNLVQCVRRMYKDFDVQIVDTDPGPAASHFELMVGGNSTDIGIQGAGGVAPFIPCDGDLYDNVITFVFAGETQDPDYLCWAAAQETAHAFGLDHEMNALDPMTYLNPPTKKAGFQPTPTPCGEYMDRTCWCGNATQNSYQYLMDTFGASNPVPPTLTIKTPSDGSWQKPGFTVHASVDAQYSIMTSDLEIDGASSQQGGQPPLIFSTPADLAAGDHTVAVTATDKAQQTAQQSITVHVVAKCDNGQSCSGGFSCLGGFCLPLADQPGGLGATCSDNSACITGTCGTDGTRNLCTAPCDGGNRCPSRFSCLSSSQSDGVCWPMAEHTQPGGCTTGGSPGPLALAFAALFAVFRRRRR
jgi:MYXO-CTERM domain-containing protein